jgi:riboflavin kinase/FMN adenylyltransferase
VILTHGLQDLLQAGSEPAVVSVGVFDGVHMGHQAILAANVARAQELGLVPTVTTFSGHPKRILLGRAPKTLTSLEHRLALFRRAGIGHTLVLEFTDELRSMPAEAFVEQILLAGLSAKAFVLGFDSKFGMGRRGDPKFLRGLGHDVQVVPRVSVDQRAISSTAIREAVELGDLEGAGRMLGRPVSVLGRVVHGQALGRTLGFPTANLDLAHELHPPTGVYAGIAYVLSPDKDPALRRSIPAVANIGTRPTLAGSPPPLPTLPALPTVEVHLLDFQEDLYGELLEFEFVANLRPEQRFADLDALRNQISADVLAARSALADRKPAPRS